MNVKGCRRQDKSAAGLSIQDLEGGQRMPQRPFNTARKASLFLMPVMLALVFSSSSYAIPAFSRMYGTSCSTCHIDFPKLNDFGKAFKDAASSSPKTTSPCSRSRRSCWERRPTQKSGRKRSGPEPFRAFRRSACATTNFFQYTGSNRNQFNALAPAGTMAPLHPGHRFPDWIFQHLYGRQFRQRHRVLGG